MMAYIFLNTLGKAYLCSHHQGSTITILEALEASIQGW